MALLHFTFGPVKGFVAQARRTRDLWAGSYLISYLAGVAMRSIGKDRITFPIVQEDDLLFAICGEKTACADFQRVGSLPNRFTASTDTVSAKQAAQAIRGGWKHIAKTVWQEKVVQHATIDFKTKRIWVRQIRSFWDITWVIGDHRNMDLRKNLRHRSRLAMREWWTVFAKGINGDTGLHLRTDEQKQCDERLCAVCLTHAYPLRAQSHYP